MHMQSHALAHIFSFDQKIEILISLHFVSHKFVRLTVL